MHVKGGVVLVRECMLRGGGVEGELMFRGVGVVKECILSGGGGMVIERMLEGWI